MGQGFKNHYESTKFQAEVWVRELLDRVPTTILRPAIVVGDSRTGETEKFDGPYYVLRALSRVAAAGPADAAVRPLGRRLQRGPGRLRGRGDVAAAGDPATLGQTLHLVDPDPLSAHELVETAVAGVRRPRHAGAGAGRAGRALAARQARCASCSRGSRRSRSPTSTTRCVYDARRTVDLLAPHGLRRRGFPEYAEAMVGFYRAHEDDPALRPKPPRLSQG